MSEERSVHHMTTYFDKDADFMTLGREKQIIKLIAKATGFIPGRVLRRSNVYDSKKVKDVVYEGAYRGMLTVLKTQSLRPALGEAEIIKAFNAQNHSRLVRAPNVYVSSKWNPKRKYGFYIMEKVDGWPIYNPGNPTESQMRDFARFYQEYATKAMTRAFKTKNFPERPSAGDFRFVDYWRKVCESKGRLKLEDYASVVMRYYPLFAKHAEEIPIVFGRSDIFPSHVFKLRDGGWALLDHDAFGYMKKWADLAMNTWNCWMEIKDSKCTTKELIVLVERWKRCYKTMPIVKKDKDFDHTFYTLLLNRSVGTLTADLGAAPRWGDPKNRALLRNNVKIHNQLFDYLVGKVESFDV